MFTPIRPALRQIAGGLTFAIACGAWVLGALLVLLLVRDDRVIAVALVAATAPFVLVPAWRRRAPMFGGLVLSLAVFLLLVEVVIRLRYFGPDALAHPARYQPIGAMENPAYLAAAPEPGVPYAMQPGFDGWVKGGRVTVNSVGVRDREWEAEPRAGVRRVMTLGSSVTFGEGVDVEHTLARQLARLLERDGIPTESLNLGVEGYVLGASQALFEWRGLRFRPDVVVQELSIATLHQTGQVVQDLRRAFERTRTATPHASFFETNSFALHAVYPSVSLRQRLTRLHMLLPRPAEKVSASLARRADLSYLENTLARFGELGATHGFTAVAFVPRPMLALRETDLHLKERRDLEAMARQRGVLYVDSYDRFSPADVAERLLIYPGDLHPNGEAHRRHAEALAAVLKPLLRASGPPRGSEDSRISTRGR